MHLNYHFLRFLCPRLQETMQGFVAVACFSQNKDELVIEWKKEEETRFLRAHFLPPQIFYSFPENFQRAKRNSIDLFPELIGEKIKSCQVLSFERAFYFEMESGMILLIKLHGNRSNILLYEPNQEFPIRVFRNALLEDKSLNWRELEKSLDLSQSQFEALSGNASKFLPTLGKIPRAFLLKKGYPEADLGEKWTQMQEIIDMLDSPLFTLVQENEDVHLTLLPSENAIGQYSDPLEALNALFHKALVIGALEREKKQLAKSYADQIKRTENFIQKAKAKLEELQNSPPPAQIANVIMANLHEFSDGVLSKNLFNFYTQDEIKITLKQNQKPQELAANLYRKSKNREIEWKQLEEAIDSKEKRLSELHHLAEQVELMEGFRDLKEFKKNHKSEIKDAKNQESLPFRQFNIYGLEVWVGKSSKDNDEMLRRFVHKNDIWLHARQAPGSHTIIRNPAGNKIANAVLERAASLAAYYSKLKNESLAPVIYTEAKYVRKIKGSAPGSVMVDREKTLLVKPEGPNQEISGNIKD